MQKYDVNEEGLLMNNLTFSENGHNQSMAHHFVGQSMRMDVMLLFWHYGHAKGWDRCSWQFSIIRCIDYIHESLATMKTNFNRNSMGRNMIYAFNKISYTEYCKTVRIPCVSARFNNDFEISLEGK